MLRIPYVSKAKAQLDEWLKDVSPSHDLRQRTHAGELDWEAFVAAYAAELAEEPARSAADRLIELAREETVTLLFATTPLWAALLARALDPA